MVAWVIKSTAYAVSVITIFIVYEDESVLKVSNKVHSTTCRSFVFSWCCIVGNRAGEDRLQGNEL